ncbi:MAG: ABC transporter ATP-binding protein [Verrucomicrobiota bacterium]|nr:ABC transporter ATP-binding protein [Verrucomicrobiota bacterium]
MTTILISLLLNIENLQKSYETPDGSVQAVVDVPSFSLESGQETALCGTSGTGKTTFLNLIAGILEPDEGRIELDGCDMSGIHEAARDRLRARTIGYIFQTFNLLQGYSCIENVLLGMRFGPGADRHRAGALLERVGLGQRLNHLPRQLSTGQQQRVAVARALANRPKLVMADEPTGNLDPVSAAESLGLIRETCRENGAALLLVSHDREVLGQFDAVRDLAQINRAADWPSTKEGQP